MLIINENESSHPLPVYEVQEVSVKEALILLKTYQRNNADSLIMHPDSRYIVSGTSTPELQGMSVSKL